MGFNIGKGRKLNSEINVTPFVDVVLVLLMIFMITAPLMYNGVQLKLPKTKKVHQLNLNQNQVILSIDSAGDYFIGSQKYLLDELAGKIQEDFKTANSDILYLRAHYGIRYGTVAKVMSYLKASGVSNIALVTEIETVEN